LQVLEAIYSEARACVTALRDSGLAEDAERLDTALYGATSGEVLSDLGFEVDRMLKASEILPSELCARLTRLLADIDKVLKEAGRL
jgi:hypothetical protein